MSDHENPYQMLESEQPVDAIVHAAAHHSEVELQLLVSALHSQQITVLGARTADQLRKLDVRSLLEQGGLIHLMKLTSAHPGHELVLERVFEDAGFCRTQGYRTEAVWRSMGRTLIQEPQLQDFFVPEALKLLSAESCPEMARSEACELGRSGELVRIKHAKALITKHASLQISAPRSKPSKATTRDAKLFRKWAFAGAVVRVEVKPTQPINQNDLQIVISDLQAALAELQAFADRTLIDQFDVA